MNLTELLPHFKGVRQHGDQFSARCPCHDDTVASLGLANGEKGIVINCHAGCETEHIVAALGIEMKDLFYASNGNGNGHAPEPMQTYDYHDATGNVVHQTVRKPGKQFRQRRPNGKGGWIWNLDGIKRVLYRLPELLKADPAVTVYFVEGEKDVDRLRSLGLIATTNPGGADSWNPEYAEPLRGRHVEIIPDNDDPGRLLSFKVAASLQDIAASVKIVKLPGVPPKGDVSDWLNTGHTTEELAALGEAAEAWKPVPEADRASAPEPDDKPEIEPLPKLDIGAELPPPPKPIVGDDKQQIIPAGELGAAVGDSGSGKTHWCIEVALGVSSGNGVLGVECQRRPVVFVSSDGDPDLARAFQRQWAGRGHGLEELAKLPLHVWHDCDFALITESHLQRLSETIKQAGGGNVVLIIESLASNAGGVELNDQIQSRGFFNLTARRLMKAHPGLTIIITHHFRKRVGHGANDPGTRIAGNVQIKASVDFVLAVEPCGIDAFTLERVKRSRSGGDFPTFRVIITGDPPNGPLRLINDGPVKTTAEELKGAKKAVLSYMLTRPGADVPLSDIVSGVTGFKTRAVQNAALALSKGDRAPLKRVSDKPATYRLNPNQAPETDSGGLD